MKGNTKHDWIDMLVKLNDSFIRIEEILYTLPADGDWGIRLKFKNGDELRLGSSISNEEFAAGMKHIHNLVDKETDFIDLDVFIEYRRKMIAEREKKSDYLPPAIEGDDGTEYEVVVTAGTLTPKLVKVK